MKLPNFFIVGGPKCGTTSMHRYLKDHPEVFMPERKEAHFFGTDLYSSMFVRDRDSYLRLFAGVRGEKRIGEASVWYLYSTRAASEIKELCPTAKIIIMLRNPVDMMYSLHSQRLRSGWEVIPDFAEALAAEDERKRGRRVPDNSYSVECLFYREIAKYTCQVKRYYYAFGEEDVHIIIFDDFQQSTLSVYQRVCDFLDINRSFTPDLESHNQHRRIRNKKVHDFLNRPPQHVRSLVRTLLPDSLRILIKHRLFDLNLPRVPRPPMDIELRQALELEFVAEVEELSRLLGQDLNFWCHAGSEITDGNISHGR